MRTAPGVAGFAGHRRAFPASLVRGRLAEAPSAGEPEPLAAAGGNRAGTDSGADVATYFFFFFIILYLYTARLLRIWKQLDVFVF